MSEDLNPFNEDRADEETIKARVRKLTVKKEALSPLDDGFDIADTIDKVEFNPDISTPDLAEIRRQREQAELRKTNNHEVQKNHLPSDVRHNLEDTPIAPLGSKPASPKVSEATILDLIRAEEIEAELVRTTGRYIESVDNAKPGVPFSTRKDAQVSFLEGENGVREFAVPLINRLTVNTGGENFRGGEIFDPGAGTKTAKDFETNASSNPNDPRSESFLTCSNTLCPHREGCLRYRLRNRRAQSFPFFPESCRKDGIYIPIDGSDYTGYDVFEKLERGSGNVRSLPSPN